MSEKSPIQRAAEAPAISTNPDEAFNPDQGQTDWDVYLQFRRETQGYIDEKGKLRDANGKFKTSSDKSKKEISSSIEYPLNSFQRIYSDRLYSEHLHDGQSKPLSGMTMKELIAVARRARLDRDRTTWEDAAVAIDAKLDKLASEKQWTVEQRRHMQDRIVEASRVDSHDDLTPLTNELSAKKASSVPSKDKVESVVINTDLAIELDGEFEQGGQVEEVPKALQDLIDAAIAAHRAKDQGVFLRVGAEIDKYAYERAEREGLTKKQADSVLADIRKMVVEASENGGSPVISVGLNEVKGDSITASVAADSISAPENVQSQPEIALSNDEAENNEYPIDQGDAKGEPERTSEDDEYSLIPEEKALVPIEDDEVDDPDDEDEDSIDSDGGFVDSLEDLDDPEYEKMALLLKDLDPERYDEYMEAREKYILSQARKRGASVASNEPKAGWKEKFQNVRRRLTDAFRKSEKGRKSDKEDFKPMYNIALNTAMERFDHLSPREQKAHRKLLDADAGEKIEVAITNEMIRASSEDRVSFSKMIIQYVLYGLGATTAGALTTAAERARYGDHGTNVIFAGILGAGIGFLGAVKTYHPQLDVETMNNNIKSIKDTVDKECEKISSTALNVSVGLDAVEKATSDTNRKRQVRNIGGAVLGAGAGWAGHELAHMAYDIAPQAKAQLEARGWNWWPAGDEGVNRDVTANGQNFPEDITNPEITPSGAGDATVNVESTPSSAEPATVTERPTVVATEPAAPAENLPVGDTGDGVVDPGEVAGPNSPAPTAETGESQTATTEYAGTGEYIGPNNGYSHEFDELLQAEYQVDPTPQQAKAIYDGIAADHGGDMTWMFDNAEEYRMDNGEWGLGEGPAHLTEEGRKAIVDKAIELDVIQSK